MKTLCIIPVKPLSEAKTRLGGILGARERQRLSRMLLLQTIRLAQQTVDTVIVVSRSSAVRAIARQLGARVLVEHGRDLNEACEQATRWALEHAFESVLILPSDLPLLTLQDLQELLQVGSSSQRAVALAPCRRRLGTNALLVKPPGLIAYAFGERSFQAHLEAAALQGIEPIIYRSNTISLDLDLPEDWEIYQAIASRSTAEVLATYHPQKGV